MNFPETIRLRPPLIFLVLSTLIFCACASQKKVVRPPVATQKLSTKYFYVFNGINPRLNHYYPSGYMGDTNDISLTGAFVPCPSGGKACLKLSYQPRGSKGWAGIYWQNPANNWGERQGGYNLSGAQCVSFAARGERGGEQLAQVKIGGITGNYPDSDTASAGPIKLTNQWKRYRIDLRGRNLKSISGGFCVVLEKAGNPQGATIYFDEIRYEGSLTAVALTLADNIPPRLVLTVSPKEFSPSDGSSVLFKLAASDNTGIESWRLEIANPQGKLVRVFESNGTPPSSISWDGKDDYYNQPVPPGIYRAVLRADDTVGNVSNTNPITIKVTGPAPQVKEVVKEVPREIKVVEEERGLRVTLTSRVLFDSGKYNLKPQASTALAELADLLKQYPDNRVRIEGHTDSVGSAKYNQKLSEKRAESVANYIVRKHQIDKNRLETVGLGESQPIAPNTTSSGRAQNRRVEIIILK